MSDLERRVAQLEALVSQLSEELRTRTIDAEAIRLVDARGLVRARLDLADGQPRLVLCDERGTVRFGCLIEGLMLWDADGVRRVSLARLREPDEVELSLGADGQHTRVALGVRRGGTAFIALYDDDGRLIAEEISKPEPDEPWKGG